jgi:hypothetical protein
MVSELQDADPRQIGPYSLLRRLGGGGMGLVYLGRSAGGRLVAVKVIRSELADDPGFRARFSHEVAAARKVNGLYTALVVDADPDGPVPWLATAYVVGPSLAEAVAAHGPLPADTMRPLAAALAEGLRTYFTAQAGSPAYVHSHDLGLDFGDWLADWPDAWGWFDSIVDGDAILPTANINIAELNDPVVNGDLAAMQQTTSASARNGYATKINLQVMNDAVILPAVYSDAVILPAVYSKVLLYRSPGLSNIYVSQYFGMYNYAVLGRS